MTTLSSRLERSWLNIVGAEFDQRYMVGLEEFLRKRAAGRKIYPDDSEIFNALNLTSFENVNVVIIGQDPYHGEGQANGLCFSVRKGVGLPPSLRNIYKEIGREYNRPDVPAHGDLTGWAQQGVLLLNTILTVEQGNAHSHKDKGWEKFTNAIVTAVSEKREHVVFLLWGCYAQKKGALINRNKHKVLKATHPSPFSARRRDTAAGCPFLGCGHFKDANDYLKEQGIEPIDWQRIWSTIHA